MTETAAMREGEGLTIEKLGTFLRETFGVGELVIEQFPAGSSNLTYLLRLGGEEFVLRRPPFGNTVKTAHDMSREFNVLSKLSSVYPPAPKPLLFCDDPDVIGSEFYIMERRRGLVIRGHSPALESSSAQLRRGICTSFITNLANLHEIDYRASGLSDLGRPHGYNRRQVEGWTKRYFAARTDEHRALESAMEWLAREIPAESGAVLIHNDYKFDNVMLNAEDLMCITAVLDWEMVTVGDPLMDLGTTLGYWMSADAGEEMLSMPFNPRLLMENVTRQQLVDIYAEASGRELPDMLFYYVFGTFKIAVIAQQIYARYVSGKTSDARFASFNRFVGALGVTASNAIQKGSI
jgi:aminoglycoside phosphotransferase (APT) family kinase protein